MIALRITNSLSIDLILLLCGTIIWNGWQNTEVKVIKYSTKTKLGFSRIWPLKNYGRIKLEILLRNYRKKHSESGNRSILSHVCSENLGLLDGYLLLFRGEKSNKDSNYHLEMNWNVFSTWSEEKVFPAICNTGRKSVIVLDKATYHTALDEEDRRPIQSWNKSRIAESILRWSGPSSSWTED